MAQTSKDPHGVSCVRADFRLLRPETKITTEAITRTYGIEGCECSNCKWAAVAATGTDPPETGTEHTASTKS
jgi:hypothetical protein